MPSFKLRPATEADVPAILGLIKELALYEKAPERVEATEASLRKTLFGERAYAEVILAVEGETAIALALYFYNYSTWLGKPGIYLEGSSCERGWRRLHAKISQPDLFVSETHRNAGVGKALFGYLGKIAKEKDCGRLDWSVLKVCHRFQLVSLSECKADATCSGMQ